MKSARKAVSPLIGVVLLIGISFAVFMVLSSWGKSYIQETKKESEEKFSHGIDCSLASIHAEQVIYNATSGNFTILLENKGSVDFEYLVISAVINDMVVESEVNETFGKGEKRVFTVHFDENACNVKLLRITTICASAKAEIEREEIKFIGC